MDYKLLSRTAPGVYETLRKAGTIVGLELTMEAHAYLNQDSDNFLLGMFLKEKYARFGGEEAYHAQLGVSSPQRLEELMSGALSLAYFSQIPYDKLKSAAAFLNCHGTAGRTVLERIITRAANETLESRAGSLTLPLQGLRISVWFLAAAAMTAFLMSRYAGAICLAAACAISCAVYIALKKNRTGSSHAAPEQLPQQRIAAQGMEKAAAALFERFYPGFNW